MKVAVTPLTRKYAQGKFRFFTLINVIPDVVAAAAGHANWSFSRSPLIFLLLLASPPPAAEHNLTCTPSSRPFVPCCASSSRSVARD